MQRTPKSNGVVNRPCRRPPFAGLWILEYDYVRWIASPCGARTRVHDTQHGRGRSMPPGGRSTGTRAAATHANANVPDENTEINLPMSELSLGDPSTATGGVDGGQLGTDGVVLKLLLPERETGHVIGKGGSVLTKIKLDSGARVRISNIDEVIPMTRERVCTIVGTLPAVLLAQKLVCNALVENARPPMDVVRPIAS